MLNCGLHSWITGISEVAQVAFVPKRLVEMQCFRTTITDKVRKELCQLVDDTVRRIEWAPVPSARRYALSAEPLYQLPIRKRCLGPTGTPATARARVCNEAHLCS